MFKADDRVRETTTTTGLGTYTRAGAPTGFKSFTAIGANNYCPYYATNDVDFEHGIGRVLTGPDRLERTHILSSSNAGNAVDWAAGSKKLRCGKPAALDFHRAVSKSVAGGVDVTLTQLEQRCALLTLTGALSADISVIVDDTPWDWPALINETAGNFKVRFKVAGQPGVEIFQGRATRVVNNGVDCKKHDEDPPGKIDDFAGGAVPDGYLACDGQNVLRATYSALFNKIGTTHGAGDGSTTFTLPDHRRRTAIGSGGTQISGPGTAVGNAGGAETHTLSTGETPVKNHGHSASGSFTTSTAGAGSHLAPAGTGNGDGSQGVGVTVNAASDATASAHNNMQPSLVVLKVIRT